MEGECSWPVPPTAPGLDAGRLFEQRAQLVRPSFQVSDGNADTVRQICRRLDGLPLAIELAAARMRILSAAQLAERLDDLFAVLTGGPRSAPRRHQALRATLDWSYELLTADERAIFRRLAIFSGGFTLAAAEQVAAGGGIAARDILDLLTRLADKSLLRVDQGSHGAHYQLLTTIRDYAKERLTEAGEAEPLRRAHLRYFTALAEEIGPLVDGGSPGPDRKGGPGLEELLDRLDLSRPDIRVGAGFRPGVRRHGGRAADRRAARPVRLPAGALPRGPRLDGPGGSGERGRACRAAGEGPAGQRAAGPAAV